MVEFLKFWWHCISNGWRFGYGVFSFVGGICALISVGLLCHKKYYQNKWNQRKQIVMKIAFSLFVTTFLVAPFLHSRHNITISINMKQEIRTLLESINPEILQKIDKGQKTISVRIGIPTQIKLSELSKQPDFDNFLSFVKTKKTIIGDGQAGDFIKELDEDSFTVGYHFYPKDALIK